MAELRLGPDGYTKIALLGTSGSSMGLAPFTDQSWAIWACSPGTMSICAQQRSDVFFETHRWMPSQPGKFGAPGTKPWFSPEFHQFLRDHKGPVFMSQPDPSIPSSVRVPFESLIEKYGPYFFNSSISWMLAMAIEALAPRAQAGEKVALGLWGIDMAASEEWAYQRPGCQHFIGLAKSLGIEIVLPVESDLMRPTTMYGVGELSPRHIRLSARLAEAKAVRDQAMAQIQGLQQKHAVYTGMVTELEYVLATWADEITFDAVQAVSFSHEFNKDIGGLLTENPTGSV
jgi:hypothetical protein